MRRLLARRLLLFLLCVPFTPVLGQNWGGVAGTVSDTTGQPIFGVTVIIDDTNFGTSSAGNGRYSLRMPAGSYTLQFSAIGYETSKHPIRIVRGQTVRLDRVLRESAMELDVITIEGNRPETAVGVFQMDPESVQNIPSPLRDPLRALKLMPGVASNNEMSNQFSVRGGGLNENLLFVEGFEIFLPFRPRQGEQEGLSLLNADLADKITFYTGGFPVRYGGKLSSALDVSYVRPSRQLIRGSAHVSLLDAAVTASSSALNNRIGWVLGVRKARASNFFETQELKGNYEPDFSDVQAMVDIRAGAGFDLTLLGIVADHEFRLDPNSRRTFFGTLSQDPTIAPNNIKSFWTTFDPDNEESDGYRTTFGGARLTKTISDRFSVSHDFSYFDTEETEQFTLDGTAVLYQVDPGSENPDAGDGQFPIGASRTEDRADNEIGVTMLTGQGRWRFPVGSHSAEVGYYGRAMRFRDRIFEKSVVIGPNLEGDIVRIVADSLEGNATFSESQAGAYLQDELDVFPGDPGKLMVTAGVRADYFSFNKRVTFSPRISARYRHNKLTSFLASWGVYYQAPGYRELRGRPEPGQTILGALNRDLTSQRSNQIVAGIERFVPSRRLILRAEAYFKDISNVISYDIENVRIRYSGNNDATAQAYGVDVQLRGEFVPGLESWASYSFLVAREQFSDDFETDYNAGRVARPTDQRHTVSLYVQDYIPGDKSWKLHLRTLFGSGLPYTPPVPGETLGNIVTQEPGPRLSARYPRYFRFDIGATKELIVFERGLSRPVRLQLTGELLNVFDMINTVSYSWVPDASGIWNRIPTRLTPRTINVRVRLEF
ncbi:MAG: TonB-dependent receptor [Rhodothermales bacterium]|nr:TonB-dependent receptor [Rhodothermales bacterium]